MSNGFEHKQAAHCENGVVSTLLRVHGKNISEPMVFGIGSGLFYTHIPFLKINQGPAISYRSMPGSIFQKFAKRTGIKIERQKFKDPQKAKQTLDMLVKEQPVGLQVGVYHLSYFPDEYRFHFNAHNLVVYSKKEDAYMVSDPVMPFVTELSEKEMQWVRFAKGPLAPKGHLYYPTYVPENLPLKKAIVTGIKETCSRMLAPIPIIGVRGIQRTAKQLRNWPKKHSPKEAAHYLAQMVRMQEEIGTGGGGFRFIYGAFLQEASQVLNNKKLHELSFEITKIGDLWRDFALQASRIYKKRNKENIGYQSLSESLLEIAQKEKSFYKSLKKSI